MTRTEARKLKAALDGLLARLERDARLHAEVQRARREFFGPHGAPRAANADAERVAEQRFQEWFLLERDSEWLGTVPVAAKALQGDEEQLLGSLVSVFTITHAQPRRVEAQDLQDDAAVELAVPPDTFAKGDLVVGRVYPRDDGSYVPSAAIALYRPGAQLAAAFARDLEQLGIDRRLSQQEIEHLLLQRPGGRRSSAAQSLGPPDLPLEHLEADLETLLTNGGAPHRAADLTAQLALAERPGIVIGPLLEELAFDTKVDLDAARDLILRLWSAQRSKPGAAAPAAPADPADAVVSAPEETTTAAAGASLGEQLVRALDEGLANKRDVEDLFHQLERMAGIAPEERDDNPFDREPDTGTDENEDEDADADEEDADEEDGEELPPAVRGAFGDLEPLVQEYLWETGNEDAPAARTLGLFAQLQQNAALPRTDLELVTGEDLMRVLLHVYLAAEPAGRAAAVRAAFDALSAFYAWAERTQELAVAGALDSCRGALLDQLDRLEAAGRALGDGDVAVAAVHVQPALLHVEEVDETGVGVRHDEGGSVWLDVPAAATAQLRRGDLLLGAIDTSGSRARLRGLVIVLPADAASLVG